MEFNENLVFTSLNADKLSPGDKVILANTMANLREDVERGVNIQTLREVHGEDCLSRFIGKDGWFPLAYLYERAENCTNCEKADKCKISIYRRKQGLDEKSDRCYEYKPKTERAEKKCMDCRALERHGENNNWCEIREMRMPDAIAKTSWCEHFKGTEEKYRPFRDTDELIKVFCEKTPKIYDKDDEKLFMPYIWVTSGRDIPDDKGFLITGYDTDNVIIYNEAYCMQELFDKFTFLDGSPCGVLE